VRILVAYVAPHPRALRLTIRQHLDALTRIANADWVLPYNAVHGIPPWFRRLGFDAVVLHTTFLSMRWNPYFERWKQRSAWLGEHDSLKIALPQDEYHHAHTLDDWLGELGVGAVGTVLDDTHRGELYPATAKRAAFYDVLTGYVDDDAAVRLAPRLRPHDERPFDVVYRARNLPYWLGSHGQLKHRIGEAAAERASKHGLRTDISTRPHETILGDAWLEFMAIGRATIGAESGSSGLDRRGEMTALEARLRRENPDLTFDEFAAEMPAGWDDYRFFALSPRHLEAVVTNTAQILVEGHYSGALEPERHYIPVRRDFSNLDDALEAIRDRGAVEEMAARAYADVYESGRFSSRRLTEAVETMLREQARGRRRHPVRARDVVEAAAAAESRFERSIVAPVANVLRVGAEGRVEILAALRVLATDRAARRLLVDYARSTETRNHVAPRQALSDLVRLAVIRRGFDGTRSFGVAAEIDRARRRLVLRSHDGASDGGAPLTAAELAELLRAPGWEFLWDHSQVGDRVSIAPLDLELPAGAEPLPILDWLARSQPADVARALAPALS
jgi:hypothetical protein